ncbi:IS4 family transposase [Dickeya dadantii]|uniref:IS4 family transposase n=1 Tax=Dickeya dadantii TaxID=204038 RepID=UPI0014954797|nr:IS4 family transposase [Dickeya dadantii]NPE53468.1 IS4 family transposase [Dickeya dadantii]
MLTTWLDDTQTWAEPASLSCFQRAIPLEWISQVLDTTQKASIRKRKFPAERVVWLVVGMGLYRDRSITDVASKLDLVLSSHEGDTLAASSIAQARQRLSDDPLRELFTLTAHHWTQQEDKDDLWHGLRLFAVDGTLFRTPDTPELAEHFEYIKHRPDRHTEYPMVRLCALMSLRSRLIHDVKFGPANTGEVSYAKQLLPQAKSLTLFDRCYLSAELLINWQRREPEAHWLVPLKANTTYRILDTFSEGDHLVEMQVSPQARKLDTTLPEYWQARLIECEEGAGDYKGFITSLTEPESYPAEALRYVYQERWSIENGYGELKQFQLSTATLLRSQKTSGIYQEIWGLLTAYNLIRVEMSQIAREARVPPLRISFVMAMRLIQDELIWCSLGKPGTIPTKLRKMRENVKQFILPEKRKRPKARAVRISKTHYPVHSKHLK